jgi:hypothetical protein
MKVETLGWHPPRYDKYMRIELVWYGLILCFQNIYNIYTRPKLKSIHTHTFRPASK